MNGGPRPDAAAFGAVRGVVTGKYFDFNPLPPPQDVLGKPLVVADLPVRKRPKEGWRDRARRVLASFRIGRQSDETLLRWKVRDTVDSVIASVSSAAPMAERRAPRRRHGRPVPVVVARHPYHLRHALELIPQLPDSLADERRFLELLMGRILRRYAEQMSRADGNPFSFENEAREYLLAGFKLERQIKNIKDADERFPVLQAIYSNYFHGRNYYYFALLRREKLAPDNKLFMLFARAVYFMARVDWNGALLEKPIPRSLPTRRDVMFFVQRDKTVLARYRSDQDFQRQVKAVLGAFPG